MVNVIKRDGRKEAFDAEKIKNSIKKAIIDAGLKIEEKEGVIEKVSKEAIKMAKEKGEIETKALRKKILDELDKVESNVSESWRKFDRRYKSMKS